MLTIGTIEIHQHLCFILAFQKQRFFSNLLEKIRTSCPIYGDRNLCLRITTAENICLVLISPTRSLQVESKMEPVWEYRGP